MPRPGLHPLADLSAVSELIGQVLLAQRNPDAHHYITPTDPRAGGSAQHDSGRIREGLARHGGLASDQQSAQAVQVVRDKTLACGAVRDALRCLEHSDAAFERREGGAVCFQAGAKRRLELPSFWHLGASRVDRGGGYRETLSGMAREVPLGSVLDDGGESNQGLPSSEMTLVRHGRIREKTSSTDIEMAGNGNEARGVGARRRRIGSEVAVTGHPDIQPRRCHSHRNLLGEKARDHQLRYLLGSQRLAAAKQHGIERSPRPSGTDMYVPVAPKADLDRLSVKLRRETGHGGEDIHATRGTPWHTELRHAPS
jgi:hypothetical protein